MEKHIEIKGCNSCRHTNICKYYEERKQILSEISGRLENILDNMPEWAQAKMTTANIRCEGYKFQSPESFCGDCTIKKYVPDHYGRRKYQCVHRRGMFTKNAGSCEHFIKAE